MNPNQYIWIPIGISLMLISGALAGKLLNNVALNKKASQSSEGSDFDSASGAVDGNKDLKPETRSCTLSKEESDPWWRVDLENVYKISAVTITNRGENASSLDGAEIWIGNPMETENTNKFRCAIISHIPAGRTFYFSCSASEGRYVTVLLPGSKKVLSLCEVEVFTVSHANPVANVALKGEATQSSTLSFATASKAIDGRRNSYYTNGFCSHTVDNQIGPWWRVDLRRTFIVTSVKVTNRGDCCAERLDGAEIRIGNSLENNGNNNPRCTSIPHIRAGKTSTFHCDGGSMEGRFVNVIIPGNMKTLTLCEVEVYGVLAVEPLQDVALLKPTKQCCNLFNEPASNAVSGRRGGNYFAGCCSSIDSTNPWWSVDLSAEHNVSAVTITSRRDRMSSNIQGAEIWIGNSEQKTYNTRCGDISSNSPTYTLECGGMQGRYIIVSKSGLWTSLTLCGVEVFATLTVPEVVPPPPPPTVSMMLGGREVTVVGERLCWSDALFYCRRHHWDLLSIRSQEEQSEVEALLGRSSFPLTDYVWLGLRRYLSDSTWFWMSGDSMKFTKWQQNTDFFHSPSPCGGVDGGGLHLWGGRPCEEPLNFICQSGAELGAKRVYFYSTSTDTSL
ncbi:hypothetical protein PBY51_005892 [Eleginops maclovinus]|uniref:C-type lectin domain-containing protein n=1 Tax=Eleginops maclovinus TaxID=56733 RepID=A0AAN8A0L4_ELEMC|nr:hypothetical protein PBY51_005892 [Eleginops maclovinus]